MAGQTEVIQAEFGVERGDDVRGWGARIQLGVLKIVHDSLRHRFGDVRSHLIRIRRSTTQWVAFGYRRERVPCPCWLVMVYSLYYRRGCIWK